MLPFTNASKLYAYVYVETLFNDKRLNFIAHLFLNTLRVNKKKYVTAFDFCFKYLFFIFLCNQFRIQILFIGSRYGPEPKYKALLFSLSIKYLKTNKLRTVFC